MDAWRGLILAVCLMVAIAPDASEIRDPGDFFFQTTLGDFQEELDSAREQGKQGILLFFEMDECPFCHRMKTMVLNRRDIQEFYRQHFLIFSVDIEGDSEITDFAGRTMREKDFSQHYHRVRATPVFAFFDLNGNRIVRYTGATKDAEEFRMLGDFVIGKKYLETNFTRYKKARRKSAVPVAANQ